MATKYNLSEQKEELFYDFILNGYDNLQLEQEYEGVVLNAIQIHTLIMAYKNPGINVTSVSKMWGHTRSAASKNITMLANHGFLEKKKLPGNDKAVCLFVTEKGERMAQRHIDYDKKAIDMIVTRISDSCTDSEIDAFFKVMEKFNMQIKEGNKK